MFKMERNFSIFTNIYNIFTIEEEICLFSSAIKKLKIILVHHFLHDSVLLKQLCERFNSKYTYIESK